MSRDAAWVPQGPHACWSGTLPPAATGVLTGWSCSFVGAGPGPNSLKRGEWTTALPGMGVRVEGGQKEMTHASLPSPPGEGGSMVAG